MVETLQLSSRLGGRSRFGDRRHSLALYTLGHQQVSGLSSKAHVAKIVFVVAYRRPAVGNNNCVCLQFIVEKESVKDLIGVVLVY